MSHLSATANKPPRLDNKGREIPNNYMKPVTVKERPIVWKSATEQRHIAIQEAFNSVKDIPDIKDILAERLYISREKLAITLCSLHVGKEMANDLITQCQKIKSEQNAPTE